MCGWLASRVGWWAGWLGLGCWLRRLFLLCGLPWPDRGRPGSGAAARARATSPAAAARARSWVGCLAHPLGPVAANVRISVGCWRRCGGASACGAGASPPVKETATTAAPTCRLRRWTISVCAAVNRSRAAALRSKHWMIWSASPGAWMYAAILCIWAAAVFGLPRTPASLSALRRLCVRAAWIASSAVSTAWRRARWRCGAPAATCPRR